MVILMTMVLEYQKVKKKKSGQKKQSVPPVDVKEHYTFMGGLIKNNHQQRLLKTLLK